MVGIVLLTLPQMAQASPLRLLGYDAQANGSGNSQVSFGSDSGVLFSNPALMSRYPTKMTLGFLLYKPNFNVSLMKKPDGTDVPITIYDSNAGTVDGLQDRGLPTSELPVARGNTTVDDLRAYIIAGGTQDFGLDKLEIGTFRFGMIGAFPVDSKFLARVESYYPHELEQYFSNRIHLARFGQWDPVVNGVLGMSYMEPNNIFSIGLSAQITMMTTANLNIYIPDASVQDYSLVNAGADIQVGIRPIVGIQVGNIPVDVLEYFSFGFVFRYRNFLDVDGGGELMLWNYSEANDEFKIPKRAGASVAQAQDFEPTELAWSLGAQVPEIGLTTQFVVQMNLWEDYLDTRHTYPHYQAYFPPSPYYNWDTYPWTATDANGQALTSKSASDYKWQNTISMNFGADYEYIDGFEARIGWMYYPTPVPAQTGRTNYADADTMGFTIGHGFEFGIGEQQFTADIAVQFWKMFERKTYKNPNEIVDEFPDESTNLTTGEVIPEAQGLQTNNPGFPGYTVDGWMLVTSASIGYIW